MIVDVSGDCEDNNNKSIDIFNNEINEKNSDNIFEMKKMKGQPKMQKSEEKRPQSPQKEEGKKEETKKEEKKEEKKEDCNIF